MRLRQAILSGLILLVLFGSAARVEAQSRVFKNGDYDFNETTGLINIPVARTLPPNALWAGVGLAKYGGARNDQKGTVNSDFLFGPNDGTMHLMWGVLPGFEVSAMFLHGPLSGDPGVVYGAKLLLNRETKSFPCIAIGVQNMFASNDNPPDPQNLEPPWFAQRSLFAVASKTIPIGKIPVDLHVGWGTGRFSSRIFYGGEVKFIKDFSVIGEYDGIQPNYGVRYTGIPRLRVTLAVQERMVMWQVGYQFGNGGPLVGAEPPAVKPGLSDI